MQRIMNNKLIKFLNITGLTWFIPLVKIAAGDNPVPQLRQLWLMMGVPLIAFLCFLGLWSFSAARVNTSLGEIPGPVAVWNEAGGLVDEHYAQRERERQYYERQQQRIKQAVAEHPDQPPPKVRPYNGKGTYLDQIGTSLATVFTGLDRKSVV